MSCILPVRWPQRMELPPQFKQGACENAKVFIKQNPSAGRGEPRRYPTAREVLASGEELRQSWLRAQRSLPRGWMQDPAVTKLCCFTHKVRLA